MWRVTGTWNYWPWSRRLLDFIVIVSNIPWIFSMVWILVIKLPFIKLVDLEWVIFIDINMMCINSKSCWIFAHICRGMHSSVLWDDSPAEGCCRPTSKLKTQSPDWRTRVDRGHEKSFFLCAEYTVLFYLMHRSWKSHTVDLLFAVYHLNLFNLIWKKKITRVLFLPLETPYDYGCNK